MKFFYRFAAIMKKFKIYLYVDRISKKNAENVDFGTIFAERGGILRYLHIFICIFFAFFHIDSDRESFVLVPIFHRFVFK